MMKAILKLFSIKKDERWAALLLTCYLVVLNMLAIQQHIEEFTCSGHVGFYSLFFQSFHLCNPFRMAFALCFVASSPVSAIRLSTLCV